MPYKDPEKNREYQRLWQQRKKAKEPRKPKIEYYHYMRDGKMVNGVVIDGVPKEV